MGSINKLHNDTLSNVQRSEYRTHSGQNGTTPVNPGRAKEIDIRDLTWGYRRSR